VLRVLVFELVSHNASDRMLLEDVVNYNWRFCKIRSNNTMRERNVSRERLEQWALCL